MHQRTGAPKRTPLPFHEPPERLTYEAAILRRRPQLGHLLAPAQDGAR